MTETQRREEEAQEIKRKKVAFAQKVSALEFRIKKTEQQIAGREQEMTSACARNDRGKMIQSYQIKCSLEQILAKLRQQVANLQSLQASIDAAESTTESLDAIEDAHSLYREIMGRDRFNIDNTERHIEGIAHLESLKDEHHSGAFSAPVTSLLLESQILDEDQIVENIKKDILSRQAVKTSGADLGGSGCTPMIAEDVLFSLPSVPSALPSSSYTVPAVSSAPSPLPVSPVPTSSEQRPRRQRIVLN
jgi:Snf7